MISYIPITRILGLRPLSHLANIEVNPFVLHPAIPMRNRPIPTRVVVRPAFQVSRAGVRKDLWNAVPSKATFAHHCEIIELASTNKWKKRRKSRGKV